MAVLGYPQGVATALTTLFERGQRFLVRRLGTRISASHLLAPASKGQLYHLSLRLLSTQDCHSSVFCPGLSLAYVFPKKYGDPYQLARSCFQTSATAFRASVGFSAPSRAAWMFESNASNKYPPCRMTGRLTAVFCMAWYAEITGSLETSESL